MERPPGGQRPPRRAGLPPKTRRRRRKTLTDLATAGTATDTGRQPAAVPATSTTADSGTPGHPPCPKQPGTGTQDATAKPAHSRQPCRMSDPNVKISAGQT